MDTINLIKNKEIKKINDLLLLKQITVEQLANSVIKTDDSFLILLLAFNIEDLEFKNILTNYIILNGTPKQMLDFFIYIKESRLSLARQIVLSKDISIIKNLFMYIENIDLVLKNEIITNIFELINEFDIETIDELIKDINKLRCFKYYIKYLKTSLLDIKTKKLKLDRKEIL